MPTVTYNNPSMIGAGIAGVAGAFAGQNKAMEVNEDIRQFNVQQGETRREFDADLAFRVDHLRQMRDENKLDRDQRDKLAELERQLQVQLQDDNQSFSDDQRAKSEIFMGDQGDKNRDVERYNIKSVKQAADYATTQRWREADQTYSIRTEPFRDRGRALDEVGRILSQYGGPGDARWNEETAFQQYLQNTTAPGSTTGQANIPQLSAKEIETKRQEFRTLSTHYPTERKRYETELEGVTAAESRGRQGLTVTDPTKTPMSVSDIYDTTSGKPRNAYGGAPINFSEKLKDGQPNPLSPYKPHFQQIDEEIEEAAITMMSFGPYNRDAVYEATLARITKKIDDMKFIPEEAKRALKLSYDAELKTAVHEVVSGDQIPAEGDLVGG